MGREGELKEGRGPAYPALPRGGEGGRYPRVATTIVGEGVGLIHAIEPAGVILERMVTEAEALLKGAARYVG